MKSKSIPQTIIITPSKLYENSINSLLPESGITPSAQNAGLISGLKMKKEELLKKQMKAPVSVTKQASAISQLVKNLKFFMVFDFANFFVESGLLGLEHLLSRRHSSIVQCSKSLEYRFELTGIHIGSANHFFGLK